MVYQLFVTVWWYTIWYMDGVCVQIHRYNISGCCFSFSLVRKKRGRVAGRHNYCEKPPPKAPDLKVSANIQQKRVTEASSTGHRTLSWTVMQLAASFWRISVTPLESLSYFSLGSSSLSSSASLLIFKHFLSAKHYAERFTCKNSSNPHNKVEGHPKQGP